MKVTLDEIRAREEQHVLQTYRRFPVAFVRGSGYTGFFLVPSAVWSFSTHVYAAARFLVEADPQLDLALFPGVGGVYTFKNQISLTLELNLESSSGEGTPISPSL